MPRVALPLQIDAPTRHTLEKFVHSPSTPQSLAMRSRIVLAAGEGSNNQQIAATLRIPAVTVGKWRRSFVLDGLEGLRDSPRSGRPPRHDSETRYRVQTRVCQQPEDQGRWSVRTLAAEVGLPASTVHAMLVAAKLQPHRIRTFNFSPDPDFEAKLLDIVGLYLNGCAFRRSSNGPVGRRGNIRRLGAPDTPHVSGCCGLCTIRKLLTSMRRDK